MPDDKTTNTEKNLTKDLPGPTVNGDSERYWSAITNGSLPLRRCRPCGEVHFMPRYLCPKCWSDDLEWFDSAGVGVVHSFTVIRRAPLAAFASHVPYVLALIELDEGPRMVANVRGDDALDVAIGNRVRVVFEDRANGTKVPQFVRA